MLLSKSWKKYQQDKKIEGYSTLTSKDERKLIPSIAAVVTFLNVGVVIFFFWFGANFAWVKDILQSDKFTPNFEWSVFGFYLISSLF